MRRINARNKTRHVSFKDTGNQLYDPLIIGKRKKYFVILKKYILSPPKKAI